MVKDVQSARTRASPRSLEHDQAKAHPHLAARGTFTTAGGVLQPAPAPPVLRPTSTATATRSARSRPGRIAPVGAHTRAVLTDFGFADVEELL